MPKPTAMQAFVAASLEFTGQLTQLRRMVDSHFGADPNHVDWADVGSLHAHVAALREITDCHFRRGEYAEDARAIE